MTTIERFGWLRWSRQSCPGRERLFPSRAIICPQYLVPAESVRTQASFAIGDVRAARRIPLALFVLGAIYKQATPALLILGALAGAMQLLDAGIGLLRHESRKCAGRSLSPSSNSSCVSASLESVRITPQTKRG